MYINQNKKNTAASLCGNLDWVQKVDKIPLVWEVFKFVWWLTMLHNNSGGGVRFGFSFYVLAWSSVLEKIYRIKLISEWNRDKNELVEKYILKGIQQKNISWLAET